MADDASNVNPEIIKIRWRTNEPEIAPLGQAGCIVCPRRRSLLQLSSIHSIKVLSGSIGIIEHMPNPATTACLRPLLALVSRAPASGM